MASPDAERFVLDTNVGVDATVESAPSHGRVRAFLHRMFPDGHELVAGTQVLRAFVAVLSRPQSLARPAPMERVPGRVDAWSASFAVSGGAPATFRRPCALLGRFAVAGRRVHDADVLACTPEAGIRSLVTCNLDDFHTFGEVIRCSDRRVA